MRPLLLLACLAATAMAEDLHAGMNKGIQANGTVYDCWLPKAYFEQPERRFPVLYCSSPGGNPGAWGFESWAERRGVIVIGITESKNGPWGPIDKAQDGTWADAEKRLRLHPCLRYAVGVSGGGAASVGLIGKHPDQFAGVLVNVHSATNGLPKHCAAVYVGGLKDDTHPISAVRGAADSLKSQGMQVWFIEDPGDHNTAVHLGKRAEPLMDWLLFSTCLSHPKLDKAGVAEGVARIEAELADIAALKPGGRSERYATLLRIPSIALDKKIGPGLRTAWAQTAIDATEGAEPLAAHDALSAVAEHEMFAGVDAKLRKDIGDRLKALRKDEPVKSAWAALQALRNAEAAEAKARAQRGALAEVLKAYQAIAKKWPETPAGKLAAEGVQRVQGKLAK